MTRNHALCLTLACACADAPGAGDEASTVASGMPGTSSTSSTSGTTVTTGTSTDPSPTTSTGPSTDHTSSATATTIDDTTSATTTSATTTDTTAATTDSSTGAAPILRITPALATVTVASGWSFPQQFVAERVDGDQVTPVAAEWILGDPSLGHLTRFGGTFQARNTETGTATIVATHDGLEATAEVSVEQLADFPVCPPMPALTEGPPAPGAFVKVVAPEYAGTGVYHGLYLPPDWQPGRRYPAIVESPCNKTQTFTGKVDDVRLAYHLAGCRSFVVVALPYIQNDANLDNGWGDVDAAVAYWDLNLARVVRDHAVDPGAVFSVGFSRGAISTSYVGLYTDLIADHWLGFLMHSHADVVTNLTPDKGAGSQVRMGRVQGRATFISWGAVADGGQGNSEKGAALLGSLGDPVTTFAVPGVGHTDAWIVDDAASRQTAQTWLFGHLAARTGTHAIRGRVTDAQGEGVADVQIAVGGFHRTTTDAAGHYTLSGLLPGSKVVTCTHPILECSAPAQVDLVDVDLAEFDFIVSR